MPLLGRGLGGQRLHLAGLTSGIIVAIDKRAASMERPQATGVARRLAERVRLMVGDAWWDDSHTPIRPRIDELRGKHAADAEAILMRKFHDDKIEPAEATRSTCDCFLAHGASLRGVVTDVV